MLKKRGQVVVKGMMTKSYLHAINKLYTGNQQELSLKYQCIIEKVGGYQHPLLLQ